MRMWEFESPRRHLNSVMWQRLRATVLRRSEVIGLGSTAFASMINIAFVSAGIMATLTKSRLRIITEREAGEYGYHEERHT